MPRLIDPGTGDAIGLDDLVDALNDHPVDVRDEDAFASLGPWLARLGRNRDFLADLAIDALKHGHGRDNRYGPQVLLLRPPDGRYILRANFWPARGDAVTRASGPATFFYDMPHDHNFPFLTYGYLGPGYWSDYYDYDVTTLAGVPSEAAGLRFVERSRLEPGKLMLYRMRRDVHVQLPPDRFSVSLNILGYDAAQPWLDQYRFDIRGNAIAEALTVAPSEALLAIATQAGDNGRDLADRFAADHPCPRMRLTATRALAGATVDADIQAALWRRLDATGDTYLRGHVRKALDALEELAP